MSHPSLTDLLDLSATPIAITFAEAPPEGVPHVAEVELASCGYWRRAAEGERFYTVADDHKACPIGAHTHNVPTTPAERDNLMSLIGTMVGLSYISMDDIPTIPTLEAEFEVAVYGPFLDGTPADVVLVRGNPRQLMLLTEAAQNAGVQGSLAPMGRPTCAILPAAINSDRTAASFGCVGNRIYTGAGENDAYFAIPGRHIDQLVKSLVTIVAANEALQTFHEGRLQEASR